MRHLQICRFQKNQKGKVSQKCSCLHQKEVNPQDKVNKSITLTNLMHVEDIISLIDEVYSLKLGIQSLAVQFMNKEDKIENIIENTDYGGKQINGDNIAPEILLKCEMCEYSFENEITLMMLMNTKHKVNSCHTCSARFKTSMKLIRHIAEFGERGKKDKLYYDELSFSCKTKKYHEAHE